MTESTGKIHIVTIGGSVRPGNFTGKALALVEDELRQQADVSLETIDPAQVSLALPGHPPTADAERLRELVSAATGVVLATPEYHGSYSSVVKQVIENLGFPSTLSGKQVALLGVAAGRIGAIKALEHLRSVCSHVGATVLPGPVSVAGVQGIFDAEGKCTDAAMEARIRGVGRALVDSIRGTVCPRIALEALVREGSLPESALPGSK